MGIKAALPLDKVNSHTAPKSSKCHWTVSSDWLVGHWAKHQCIYFETANDSKLRAGPYSPFQAACLAHSPLPCLSSICSLSQHPKPESAQPHHGLPLSLPTSAFFTSLSSFQVHQAPCGEAVPGSPSLIGASGPFLGQEQYLACSTLSLSACKIHFLLDHSRESPINLNVSCAGI